MNHFSENLSKLKKQIRSIPVNRIDSSKFIFIDIREESELIQGVIPNSIHIPRGLLELKINELDLKKEYVLYCESGIRSILACNTLESLGFSSVYSLEGGFSSWKKENLVEFKEVFSDREKYKYSRQISVKEIGIKGQLKLKNSSVIVIGAGGLGCPILQYLNSCGVGKIGIIDYDTIDESNLHRQILFEEAEIGQKKGQIALNKLKKQNTFNQVIFYDLQLTDESDFNFLKEYDLIIDGTDNFKTKYLLNKIITQIKRPFLTASLNSFEGQIALFKPWEGPCYQCLFPEPPIAGTVLNCSEAGVIGVLPGVIGAHQAFEAIKYLLQLGISLEHSLLSLNPTTNQQNIIKMKKDPNCSNCSF